MGAISGAECCVDEYNDNRKAEERKQALVEQEEYNKHATPTPNGANHEIKDIMDMNNHNGATSKSPSPTIVALNLPPKEVAPWDINSRYHNDLSYMEMSARYERYRKPPNFYDDCIRKLRSTKRRYKSTQKQAQYDMIIQNTAKALLRTRTMLTASMEETQQTSATNLIHEISEDDEKFWFQPFLYNVIDSITNSFIKLIDSKQDLLLNYVEFYQILQSLPVLTDVLAKDYPFHFHSEIQDRIKYLFDPNDIQYIKTKQDIINIISKAKKLNRKISAVGYATSFPSKHDAEEKSNNSPLIAAMIPDHLRQHTYDTKLEYAEDLSKVTIPDYPLMFVEDIGDNKIRIGGATPVWLYREWCHKRIEAKKPIPSEPGTAMSINHSFVGLITVAEHGGGIFASSLSDYVTKMKVINSEGEENEYSIDDKEEFQAIIPNLGLLGIVTEIELQFKEEYYCNLSVRVINIDKLFPKSKSKKSKGRTFSKVFEDIINATVYNEFFWFPTTNQIYSLSLSRCEDFSASSQFFPSKTWEKNWVVLQKEINTLSEILSIQLLNGRTWTSKLCTKLITKISSNLLNDLVIKLNLRSKVRKKVSSPRGTNRVPQSMKIPSCDALHLFNFYPSQNNNNLFQNIEWLFPLDSASAKKILINDHHVPNVDLAAHLFMSAINCYNQNMLKKKCYPYQLPLNLKVIKGSEYGLSHCNGADFYCAVSMSVHDIEHNEIFQRFQREFIQTCKSKVYRSNIDGIKPHWKNASLYKYLDHPFKNGVNGKQQNGYSDGGDIEGIYGFIRHQYEGKLDKLVEIAQRDNKNAQIFQPEYLNKIFQ